MSVEIFLVLWFLLENISSSNPLARPLKTFLKQFPQQKNFPKAVSKIFLAQIPLWLFRTRFSALRTLSFTQIAQY